MTNALGLNFTLVKAMSYESKVKTSAYFGLQTRTPGYYRETPQSPRDLEIMQSYSGRPQ